MSKEALVQSGRTIGVGESNWAVAVPLLCAVHCASAPVLVLIAPRLATSAAVEVTLMSFSFVVALWLVTRDYRAHGHPQAMGAVLLGGLLWLCELGVVPVPSAGPLLAIAGSLFMAGGLLWSGRMRRRVLSRCDCPAHR